MAIVKELEKVIAELPTEKAIVLKYWLDEFEAARRYKKLKAHALDIKILADFNKCKGDILWN